MFFAICMTCMFRLCFLKVGESLVEVLHQRGIPTGKVLWGREPAKVCERLERGLVATGELDDPCQCHTGQGARARSRSGLSGDHASTKLVPELPPSGLGFLRCVPVFFATRLATASDSRHRFDRGEHIVRFDVAIRMRARVVEERPKALESLDLDIHTIPVGTQNVADRSTVVLEHMTDVREREAEITQRADAIEASNVVLVVNSLIPIRP
jgi:hypothetical protein